MEETGTVPTSRHSALLAAEPGSILQNIYVVVLHILNNLDYKELMKCKQVCWLWKRVVDVIVKNRIFILRIPIPIYLLRRSILEPEQLFPYLQLQDTDVQFVQEYPLHESCAKNIEHVMLRLRCNMERSELIHYGIFFSERRNSRNELSVQGIAAKIAIFPSVPGIKIHRFFYTYEEMAACATNRRLNLIEKIKVPEEELKCVLWFVYRKLESRFLALLFNCKYAMGGVDFPAIDLSLCRGIAISGKRINAASLQMCVKTTDNRRISPKFSKQQIQQLKTYKIDQKKCVGFLFIECNCNISNTLSIFKESFPTVPVLIYRCNHALGIEYLPSTNQTVKNKMVQSWPIRDKGRNLATLVLVWFN